MNSGGIMWWSQPRTQASTQTLSCSRGEKSGFLHGCEIKSGWRPRYEVMVESPECIACDLVLLCYSAPLHLLVNELKWSCESRPLHTRHYSYFTVHTS